MTEPLRMSFDVACPAEHAFTVWTSGIGAWWPPDHTMTGRPAAVVLEGGVGGRIYERTADGTEHEWGEVTVWQPPGRLGYLWYLGRDRNGATEVEIRFLARGPGATRSRSSTAAGTGSARTPGPGGTGITATGNPCSATSWPRRRKRRRKGSTDGRWHQGRPVGAEDPAGHL